MKKVIINCNIASLKIASALFILTIFFSSSVSLANLSCVQFVSVDQERPSLPVRAYRSVRDSAQDGWKKFRSEVKEQGKIRYLVAPRDNPKKFHALLSFMDPLIDFPIEMTSWVRHRFLKKEPLKRRPSIFLAIPLSMFVWSSGFLYLDHQAHTASTSAIESGIVQDRVGVRYMSKWILDGSISATDAVRSLSDYESTLKSNIENIQKLERISDFIDAGLLSSEQSLKFSEHVQSAVDHSLTTHGRLVDDSLRTKLQELIATDEAFSNLNQNDQFLLNYVFWPIQKVGDKSEVYWYNLLLKPDSWASLDKTEQQALSAIRELAANHGDQLTLPDVVQLVEESLNADDYIQSKLEKHKIYALPDTLLNIASRADIPLFSTEVVFKDIEGDLKINDEMDRWNLIFNDPRFSKIKQSWQKGQISGFIALLEATIHIESLSQLYSAHKAIEVNPVQTQEAINLLVNGSEEQTANPIFKQFRKMSEDLGLSGARKGQFEKELGLIYLTYFVNESKLNSPEQKDSLYSQARLAERRLIEEYITANDS